MKKLYKYLTENELAQYTFKKAYDVLVFCAGLRVTIDAFYVSAKHDFNPIFFAFTIIMGSATLACAYDIAKGKNLYNPR